jgi:hypothetical protein
MHQEFYVSMDVDIYLKLKSVSNKLCCIKHKRPVNKSTIFSSLSVFFNFHLSLRLLMFTVQNESPDNIIKEFNTVLKIYARNILIPCLIPS